MPQDTVSKPLRRISFASQIKDLHWNNILIARTDLQGDPIIRTSEDSRFTIEGIVQGAETLARCAVDIGL